MNGKSDEIGLGPGPDAFRFPETGFIGAGRLATALARALCDAGVPVTRVASRRPESAQALARALRDCRAVPDRELVRQCDLVFITTPDAMIAEVARSLPWRAGQAVVHCSGATPVSVLRPAADAGAHTGGFHPLQAFGGNAQAAIDSLPGCTIAIEADAPLEALLRDFASRLKCVGLKLPPGARARYHAAGGYASQHVHVLLAEAVRLWQSWGATERQALDALLPLLRGTIEAIARDGVAQSMPGPVSRGDDATIRAHRQALRALDPDMCDLYDRLCQRGIGLACQAGKLDETRIQALRAALQDP